MTRNSIVDCEAGIIIQGAASIGDDAPESTSVRASVFDNEVGLPRDRAILVSNGVSNNEVLMTEGAQAHEIRDGHLLKELLPLPAKR